MTKKEKKEVSSLRSCSVRLFSSNSTSSDTITFNDDDVFDLIDNWKSIKNYAYIKHKETDKIHWHFYLEFKNPVPFSNIKNHFESVSHIEKVRNKKKCIQYLIHYNDSDKFQYHIDDIITNMDLKSIFDKRFDIDLIIDDIKSGKITQYNYTNYISITTYSKFKTVINNAFDYYIDSLKNSSNRSIKVMFFTGASGSGKTLYAKNWCNTRGFSYSISSSSNDPLQDYAGQDVLILDDLREDSFTFQDLLKVLDNHTNTSIKSRYRNKYFLGSTIIITSCYPLLSWYIDIYNEDKLQLYRRIPYVFDFGNDVVKMFKFNISALSYDFMVSFKNPKQAIIDSFANAPCQACVDEVYQDIVVTEDILELDMPY